MTNVINLESMFSGCNSLTILDLTNFNIPNAAYINEMFKYYNEDLIFCLNNENKDQILSRLNYELSSFNSNCSYICIENRNLKFIFEENKCLDNCFNDGIYRYEYNKICITGCPARTHHPPSQPFFVKMIF